MANVKTWAWIVESTWPGYDPASQDNLGSNGDLLSVDPSSFSKITWIDADNDDRITDADTDDESTQTVDLVRIGNVEKTVAEVARYDGTVLLVDGTTLVVTMPVWLFTDGTWMTRLNDVDIPAGKSHLQVSQITLGTFDGAEYVGTWVSTRDQAFVCFTAGTLILGRDGPVPIETIRPGDLIVTADHGLQPVRWLGRRTVRGTGALAPVRIAAGAMGNDRDLTVSQQHRMLVSGWRAQLFAGAEEVLVAARHLVNDDTIRIAPCASVTYVHLLFDRHEIVFAEGCPSESFHPGATGLSRLDAKALAELLAIFPELARPGTAGKTARPCVTASEGLAIAAA